MDPVPSKMRLVHTEGDEKPIYITCELDNTNIDVMKGLLGNLVVKKAEKLKIAAILGCIVRTEKIPTGSVKEYGNPFICLPLANAYQNIQLLAGHPYPNKYRFFYPIPKNYCCTTTTKEKSNGFDIDFEFAIKVVTEEGPFICEKVPITLYRVKPKPKK